MDPELKALAAVAEALASLDEDAISRVLKWAAERFNVQLNRTALRVGPGVAGSSESQSAGGTTSSFADFHELFDAAQPANGPDKALLAAYWFQVTQGHEDLDSQTLNKELKNLGHPSTNITRDLDSLINRTPRYVMQVRKEGNSKQARKKYKVTREGIKAVERMLNGSTGADQAERE